MQLICIKTFFVEIFLDIYTSLDYFYIIWIYVQAKQFRKVRLGPFYLNTLGLITIQGLIDTEVYTMVFKTHNSLAPEHLSDLFEMNSESHLPALRNTNTDLQVPKKTTNHGQKYFSYRGIKSWNAIPPEIKQKSPLKAFKLKLK